MLSRGVAQPGSALAWGARGREFESRRPDQLNQWVDPHKGSAHLAFQDPVARAAPHDVGSFGPVKTALGICHGLTRQSDGCGSRMSARCSCPDMRGGLAGSAHAHGRGAGCPAPAALPPQRQRSPFEFHKFQRRVDTALCPGAGRFNTGCGPRAPVQPAQPPRASAPAARAAAVTAGARPAVEPDLRRSGRRTAGLRLAVARAAGGCARPARRVGPGAALGGCGDGCATVYAGRCPGRRTVASGIARATVAAACACRPLDPRSDHGAGRSGHRRHACCGADGNAFGC